MFEAMTHFNLDAFTHLFSVDEVMGPYSRPSVSQSYVLDCRDGKWIALHMSSPAKFWQGLAKAMERPDIFDDARFASREARIENQEAMIEVHGSDLPPSATAADWCARLEARGRAACADVHDRRSARRSAGPPPAAVRRDRAPGRRHASARCARRSPSTASARWT